MQIGSQRVSSVICAKAKEMIAQGIIGTLTLVEGSLGRNDPTGAWEYPPPPDLSPANLDWDTWQGDGAQGAVQSEYFCALALLEGIRDGPCRRFAGASGQRHELHAGLECAAEEGACRWARFLRFPDGRNMPDVHATLFDYGSAPVYLRLNLGCETPEIYRFQGSKGILEVTEFAITYYPQTGEDSGPSYYTSGYPQKMRDAYVAQWHAGA